jgi:hypothetical protein
MLQKTPATTAFKFQNEKGLEEIQGRVGCMEILDKTPFTVTKRYVGFATDNKKDEYEKLGNEYHHIIFTDRSNAPTMKKIGGTKTLHEV